MLLNIYHGGHELFAGRLMNAVESRTDLIQAISGKWTFTVMAALHRREIGFSELLAETEMEPKQMVRVLERLRQFGLVERFVPSVNSSWRPRYRLSEIGSEVLVRTGEIAAAWAESTGRKNFFSDTADCGTQ
ncbi:winged helix-turn-helix transcriptional regulator [Amycolatopsis sp. NPDC059090]|uniref:winged helix-turn-helix transcriptional regulator n=1 Tax=unclassified Amycolatopsis TaxID=2618356 RepID=UPI00366F2338